MIYGYLTEGTTINSNEFKPLEVDKKVYDKYCKGNKKLEKDCPVATDKIKPILVLYKEDIVGYMHITKYDGHIYITDLYIYPKYRDKGFSKYFLDLATKKYKATHISVYSTNKKAIHIYEKYGFKTFEDYTDKDGKVAHFMSLGGK